MMKIDKLLQVLVVGLQGLIHYALVVPPQTIERM